MTRRAGILLEVMLSLAIFVAAALTITTTLTQAVGGVEQARHLTRAADIARSAMAELEAGLKSPLTVAGPVPVWTDEPGASDEESLVPHATVGGGPQSSRGEDTSWEIEIETERSSFTGLTLVTLRVLDAEGRGRPYTLRQLVRLGDEAEDDIGEFDEMMEFSGRARPRPAPRTGGAG